MKMVKPIKFGKPNFVYLSAFLFLGINIALNPRILTPRGINNVALQTVTIALAVMAQTMVITVRELDLSIGAVISMTTVIIGTTMGTIHGFSIPLALLSGAFLGFVSGSIVAWIKIPGIVVTLAMSMIIAGLALVIMPQPSGNIDSLLAQIITGKVLNFPNSLALLIFILLIWKYVKKTRLGTAFYAVGGNPFSAFASGLSVEQTKIAAYMISGVLAACAGIVVAGKTLTGDATIGDQYTMTSITGAVLGGASFLGGVSSMRGAVAGALTIGVLINILFFFGLSSHYQSIAEGVILFSAVVIGLSQNKGSSN
jgi:ribose transport system permease protein